MGSGAAQGGRLAIALLALAQLPACHAGPSPRSAPTFAAPGRRPHDVARYRPHRPRQIARAALQLPGERLPRRVSYEVVDGMAVMEGDILLGPAHSVTRRFAPRAVAAGRPAPGPSIGAPTLPALPGPLGWDRAMPTTDAQHLWPRAEIPYEVHPSVSADRRQEIEWAIGEMAAAGLKVRPRTASDADHVVFQDVGEGCNSHIGRVGGAQAINLTGCGPRVTLHELMHAAGFQHEHARSDRDGYISIQWEEIADDMRYAFEKADDHTRDAGPYDYDSIVHYPTYAFSKRGNATIVPLREGVEIGLHRGLSTLDRAGIQELYGLSGPVVPPGSSPPGTSPPGTSPPGTSPPGTSPPGGAPPAQSPWPLPQGWPPIPGLPGQQPAPPGSPPGSSQPGWPPLPPGWPAPPPGSSPQWPTPPPGWPLK